MGAQWPPHFPCPIRENYAVKPPLLTDRIQYARGARVRKQFSDGRQNVTSISVFLTADQWAEFQRWVRDEVNPQNGVVDDFPILAGGVFDTYTAMLYGSMRYNLVGIDGVKVTFSVEAYVPQYYDEETYEYVKGWGGADQMWLALQAMENMVNSEWLSE